MAEEIERGVRVGDGWVNVGGLLGDDFSQIGNRIREIDGKGFNLLEGASSVMAILLLMGWSFIRLFAALVLDLNRIGNALDRANELEEKRQKWWKL